MNDLSDLRLPPSYIRRVAPEYFDDPNPSEVNVVWQPEVYPLAAALARRFGSKKIIDIGCGRGDKVAGLASEFEVVGIDHLKNLELARSRVPRGFFYEWNLEEDLEALGLDLRHSVVVCSDVIEHLTCPDNLLSFFARQANSYDALVISTPDRDRARGRDDLGPPANPHHVQEWALSEFSSLLRSHGVRPVVHGWTRNISSQTTRNTQVAVSIGGADGTTSPGDYGGSEGFRIEAFIPCFNEVDVIAHTVSRMSLQVDKVTVVDNWSNDGTWELLRERFEGSADVHLTRFPDAPDHSNGWQSILRFIDKKAAGSDSDWVIRVDADEIFESFSPDVSLREAIMLADRLGFDAFDSTLLDFRPTVPAPTLNTISRFEFSSRSGARHIQRVWKNRGHLTGMPDSGGHILLDERRLFPLNLVLRHYPLRGTDHALKKIFDDRRPRFAAERATLGWHTQYENFSESDVFTWPEEDLIEWSWRTPVEYLPELVSRAGLEFETPI